METKQDREVRSMLDMAFFLLMGYMVVYPFNQGLHQGDKYVDMVIGFLREYLPLYVKPSFLTAVKATFLALIPVYCFTISKEGLANKIESIKQTSRLFIALNMAVFIAALTIFYVVVPDMGSFTPDWLSMPSLEEFVTIYLFFLSLLYLYCFKSDAIFYMVRFSKHYEKFITAVYRKGDKKDKRGYDTLKVREKVINKPVVGHKDADLHFKHKLVNGTKIYNGNPRRANLIVGTAGSGKSYSILDPMIVDTIKDLKVPMLLYDFKFPTQIPIALESYIQMKRKSPNASMEFNVVTLKEDKLLNSWRMNPICSETIVSDSDPNTYMRVLMGAIKPEWARPNDFWGSSVLTYTSGVTFAFKKHFPGYTLAHILAFMNMDYESQAKTIIGLDDDEVNARLQSVLKPVMEGKGVDQIQGVFSTLQNETARLNKATTFFGISKTEASLLLNNPDKPSILCLGNDNFYKDVFGPLYSLVASIVFNKCNALNKLPLHVMFDEAPTLFLPGLDDFINTGRSNGMITTVGIQNMKQLYSGYGKELADVLVASFSNYYVGQTSDEQLAGYMSKLMGNYRVREKNYSTSADLKKSSSESYKDMPILPLNEIQSLPKGYFAYKMAEGHRDGSIDSSMAMGMTDVKAYESTFKNASELIMPLSPSVTYLAKDGKITKEQVSKYYQGDKEAAQEINSEVLAYATREYHRIIGEVKLFIEEHKID